MFQVEDPISFWEAESRANARQIEFKTESMADELDDVRANIVHLHQIL